MPKRSEDLIKHSLYLKKEHMELLRDIYPEVSAAQVVRTLINKHLREVEDRVNKHQPIDTIDIIQESN
jgi:hypothetical protein